ncbi:MAG: Sensor histidine kinase YycG [Actinobacteria bacterium ADurb.Bin346]|nr:MAG: Sensor histidine kinase YycG [Actinobacteria bacterium ADurb.Bin346]
MNEGVIALIGAGNGGLALLKVLLDIPGVIIKYVCDINPNAAGVLFAKQHNIKFITSYGTILSDGEVNLIFEATGNPDVFKDLSVKKSPEISLIGAEGSRIIYNLLDAYNEINLNLNEYKNNLEQKIIERTEELERTNVELEKEMLEYEKLSHKLQEMNEEKTKYLLYATHQLKAPFAAIQSYVDIMLEGYAGQLSHQTRDIVLKIRERCKMLTNVIKEMLELAKLKSRDAEDMIIERLDITDILAASIQKCKVIAQAKDIKINFKPPLESFYIRGNAKQIDILFTVLIENAINYSADGTEIDVIINKTGASQVSIAVKDHGIGIPEKNIGLIFNEFFRSNNAVEFHNNGTGLGLSIAKEIAEIHHTNIHAESIVGKGSTFSVIFRLA